MCVRACAHVIRQVVDGRQTEVDNSDLEMYYVSTMCRVYED